MLLTERLEAAQAQLLRQKVIIEDLRSALPSLFSVTSEESLLTQRLP